MRELQQEDVFEKFIEKSERISNRKEEMHLKKRKDKYLNPKVPKKSME
jgi:hypothetical protein